MDEETPLELKRIIMKMWIVAAVMVARRASEIGLKTQISQEV